MILPLASNVIPKFGCLIINSPMSSRAVLLNSVLSLSIPKLIPNFSSNNLSKTPPSVVAFKSTRILIISRIFTSFLLSESPNNAAAISRILF